ncbi:MAG: ThiF family adenylyltransferase [Anaerolineae bacterium]|nr:ThiF family adenylyltransferase [Anaerolineae bacterium]
MKLYAYEGAWQIDRILIVGAGGTGSALARITARILWQRVQLGQTVPLLHLVDPDQVEEKNVGRQGGFSPADVGGYKAEILAKRYSLALGLPILWSNEPFDPQKHMQRGTILVGCVDNHEARQALVQAGEGTPYLDLGNSRTHGQLVFGSTQSLDKAEKSIRQMESNQSYTRHGNYFPCHDLPNIALLYPELLEPEPEPKPAIDAERSCGELVAAGEQSLLVNDFMGVIGGQYLYKLINREPLTTFMSQVDLNNLTVISRRICPEELYDALHVPTS